MKNIFTFGSFDTDPLDSALSFMVDGTFLLFINRGCGIIPNKYHLLTKSEIIRGKSQTKALMYWLSDSEVNTYKGQDLIFPCEAKQTRLISY